MTPFDPSQLSNPLWLFRGDAPTTTFTFADLSAADVFHPQYFQTANSAFLNGLSKLTLAFTALVPSNQSNSTLPFFAQDDGAGTQMCFNAIRVPVGDAVPNALQVRISRSLTDAAGAPWGKFALTPLDGRMTHFTTPTGVKTATPELSYTVVVVFDGTQATNAGRLRCYVNGVLDSAATYSGTIPAVLTSSSAPLTWGYSLNQGGLCTFGLYNCGVWAGTAFDQTQVNAYGAVARSGWPAYKTYAQLVAGGLPAATAFWQMDEASNGSGAVGRADATGGGRALSEFGSGGFVKSNQALQWAESLSGDVAQSVAHASDTTAVALPFVVPADTPSGKPAVRFPTGFSTRPAQKINQMQLGRAGLSSWPASARVWVVLKKDDNVGDSTNSEQNICGADSTNGAESGLSYSTNAFMAFDTEDFSFGSYVFHPGSVSVITGSGLGNWNFTPNDPNSHPGANAGTGPANSYNAGQYFLIRGRFTAGTDVCPQLWINSVQQAVLNQGETPSIPVGVNSDHFWEDISQCGAPATCYCIGGTSGEWANNTAAGLQGNVFLFCAAGAGNTEDQAAQMDVWAQRLAGLAPAAVAAPAGLAASPGPTLNWSAAPAGSGVNAYNVYRGTAPGAETLYASGVAGTSYADTGAAPNTTYYYKITAAILTTAGNAESPQSSEVSAESPPAAPALSGLSRVGPAAYLFWPAVSLATSYDLYRGTASGGETLLVSGLTATNYNDTAVSRGATFYYKVTASGPSGVSAFSNEAGVTIPAATLFDPSGDWAVFDGPYGVGGAVP